jgi:D-alanyl-D-alanine carboxypeptidase
VPGTGSATGATASSGGVATPAGPSESTTPGSTSPPPATEVPSGDALEPALVRKLQKILDRTQARVGIPGLSAAVLLDDGRTWTGTVGERQVSPSLPVDESTVFAIASITKTFVAAAAMELVAEGKLSLSDRLDQWVPSVTNARRITIEQLLHHTSGVYNYFENPRYNGLVFKDSHKRWTFDQIMALVLRPYCKPGTCYHYSNTNFVLLGRVIELVTKQSLGDVIEARFGGPLALDDTSLQPDLPTPANRAHAYTGATDWTGKSKVIPTMSTATVAGAAGAMVSTATDLADWASSLYTGEVIPEPQLGQMLTFVECHDNYGLGTRKLIINGRVAYGHLGSLRGYTDAMWYFPEEHATIVLLSNQGGWNIDAAVRKLQSALFEGIGAPEPAFDPNLNTRNHDGVTLRC